MACMSFQVLCVQTFGRKRQMIPYFPGIVADAGLLEKCCTISQGETTPCHQLDQDPNVRLSIAVSGKALAHRPTSVE